MAKCDTNIIQLNQTCDTPEDIHVANVEYNSNNGLLRLTLTDGTEFDTTISAVTVTLDPDGTNQLVNNVNGLYVGGQLLFINGEQIDFDDTIAITSSDSSIDITTTTVGTNTTIDLVADLDDAVHPALSVTSNQAYSFNPTTQVLNLPLPTFSNPSPNSYYFAMNDGSGTSFTINVHPSLSVTNGAPFSFTASTQALVLPIPAMVDNEDGTYTYTPGDGTADITIEASNSYDNSGSNLLALTLQGAVDELANTNSPFAAESLGQGTVSTALTISEDIYRTGSVGIGLNNLDTIQGILHTDGDIYHENGSVNFLFGTAQEFSQVPVELTTTNQYRINTDTRTTLAVTSEGNISTDVLPDDMFGAANTMVLVANNNSGVPAIPTGIYHVTNFAMEL